MVGRRMQTLVALSTGLALSGLMLAGSADAQQAQGSYGAIAGHSYVPSSNDAGCSGLLCNPVAPADPSRPNVPSAPPACGGGLLCEALPFSVGRPFPTADAVAAERARAEATAAAAAQPEPAPAKPMRKHRKRKVRSAAASPRTAAPAEATQ